MTRYLKPIGIYGFALALASLATLLGEGQQKVQAFIIFGIVGLVLGIGLFGDKASRNETARMIAMWIVGLAIVTGIGLGIVSVCDWLGLV